MKTPTVPRVGPVDSLHSLHALWKTLNSQEISLNPGFWTEKQATNRKVSLEHAYHMLEKNGNFHNLRLAAGLTVGEYQGRNFLDSDVYKWLEAAAWELGNQPDPGLQHMVDQAIALVAAAQRPDGYINSFVQATKRFAPWEDLDHGHELYCAGHLFQAAVAFHRSLGDDRLLDIACRFADHICNVFGEDGLQGTCGHPEIEMALMELYRATGTPEYLKTAAFLIDYRGKRKMVGLGPYGPEYQQDHLPVREVDEAVGHAVRQLYLACGVTDLYLETGEPALLAAMRRLFQDIVGTKIYITGGVGSRFDGESFGDPYELPPDQCYCETCAAIASFMWNWRMLLASGDSCYADQMERALYNNILASPAQDGRHYAYINPLQVREARFLRSSSNPSPQEALAPTIRPEWHDVACCPPNVMRLFASLRYYLATRDARGIQIHHYAPADLDLDLAEERRVGLRMTTGYPWQGQIRLEISGTDEMPWAISLRIPEWSQEARLAVNGQALVAPRIEKGYVALEQTWQVGDVVEIDLNLEAVLVAPAPRVDAVRGCLAIQRGPVVYCLEDCDQEVKGGLLDVVIDPDTILETGWQEGLLGGVVVIQAAGELIDNGSWKGKLYQRADVMGHPAGRTVRLTAIPYFSWGNRSIGPMRVWIPKK